MPSSTTQTTEEDYGCVEGILVETEKEVGEGKKVLEVCLADDKGEELDLIIWEEEIKEGESTCSFSVLTRATERDERSSNAGRGRERTG